MGADTDFFLRALNGDVNGSSRMGRQNLSEASSLKRKIMESRGLLTLTPHETSLLRSMLESRNDDPFIDGEINLEELEKVGLTPNFTSPGVKKDGGARYFRTDDFEEEGHETRLYAPHEALIAPNCTPGTSSPIDSSLVQFEAPKAPQQQQPPVEPAAAAPKPQTAEPSDDDIKRQAAAILSGVAVPEPSSAPPANQSVAESIVSAVKSVRKQKKQLQESEKKKVKPVVPDAVAAKIAALG